MKKTRFTESQIITALKSNEAGLVDPVFLQEDTFNVTIYRQGYGAEKQVPTKYPPSTDEVPQEYRRSSNIGR